MLDIWNSVVENYNHFIFFFASSIMLWYLIISLISIREILLYKRKNSLIDFKKLLSSPYTPAISIIAPAFNEGKTIISNVHSLLSLQYPRYEVIIVNDGSSDSTLIKLVKEFSLVIVDFAYHEHITTGPIRGIYKSTDPAYSKLIVLDKENRKNKADALNTGINIAANPYYVCCDVDCIIDNQALLKLIKPVLDEEKRVIANGAVIRIANGCDVEQGFLVNVKAPKNFLTSIQEVEYLRSFLLGRMAWSKINGLIIVSGGIGLFDKKVAVAVGGYDTKSFGEDMEMTVRMRKYMNNLRIDYQVKYIPESLCWTEVPPNLNIFIKQRVRWTKGLVQTLLDHRKMWFNTKYGRMGIISFPYWIFYEWLAPLIEFFGLLIYIYLIASGLINLEFSLLLLGFVFSYAVMITTISIIWEEYSNQVYKSKKEIFQLLMVVLLEPFFYHPLIILSSIKGNLSLLFHTKHQWGDMGRMEIETPVTPTESISATDLSALQQSENYKLAKNIPQRISAKPISTSLS